LVFFYRGNASLKAKGNQYEGRRSVEFQEGGLMH